MTEHGTTTDAAGPDPDKAVSNAADMAKLLAKDAG